jgi:hypothetical protein
MVLQVITNKRQGRKIQSRLAKLLGGKSVGTIEGQDISFHDQPWSIEVKHRQAFVAEGWMAQARKNAPAGKTPLVIVHSKGKRMEKSLVIISLEDWVEWYGKEILDASKHKDKG